MALRRVSRVVEVPVETAGGRILHSVISMSKLNLLPRSAVIQTLVEGLLGAEEGWHKANVMDAEVKKLVGGYR